MYCPKCLNKNRLKFKKCLLHENCFYCLKCRHLKYTCLKTKQDPLTYIFPKANFNLAYNLTPTQIYFSMKLEEIIKTNHIFINAVCGCGKTELLYQVIKNFVNKKKRIVIVIPRITLLTELASRFNGDFNIYFHPLYGKQVQKQASVFLMTPQKLLNYKKEFDLIIVDEIDAFPLYDDMILYRGLFQALKEGGRQIFMSATPLKIEKGFKVLTIYKRYHNFELPLPIIKSYSYLNNILQKNTLIFFPSITSLENFSKNLHVPHAVIHSRTRNQQEIITTFRKNGGLLLTTTILERGVTFKNINVIVYQASHRVFTKNILIQIAGRVNRHHDYQKNSVYFIDNCYSIAIYRALKHIKEMNRYLQMSKLLFEI